MRLLLLAALVDTLGLPGQLLQNILVLCSEFRKIFQKCFRKRRVRQRAQRAGIAAEAVSQFILRKRHAEVWGLSRAAIRSCPAERVVPRVVRDEKQLRLSAAAGNSAGLLSDFELSRLPGKAQKHQRLVLRLIHSPVPPSSAPVRPEPPAGSAC